MQRKKTYSVTKPKIGLEEWKSTKKVYVSGWLTEGRYVEEFEKNFSKIHRTKYAVATANCTVSLHLILKAIGIKQGDEVIVPAFTWVTTANSILYCNAKPVFIDIDYETLNIDYNQIKNKISKKTKAIIVVNLFGLCVDIKKIKKIVGNKIKIIEDSACAAGAKYNNFYSGMLSDAAAFSFHPRKIITTGEGGMIVTNDKRIYKKIKILKNHGASQNINITKFKSHIMPKFNDLGFNYRMTDIQACVGIVQLKKLINLIKERNKLSVYYKNELKNILHISLPTNSEKITHGWQAYVVKLPDKKTRNRLMEYLENNKIYTRPGTHAVVNLDFYKKKFKTLKKNFPNAIKSEETTIALPFYNEMEKKDVEYISKKISNFFNLN